MYLSLVFVHCLSHPCLVVLCKFNTVSGHISQCVCFVIYCCLSLFKCDNFLSLCFSMSTVLHWYTMLSFVLFNNNNKKKHAVVYFSIICKLINKKNLFFFPSWKLLYVKRNRSNLFRVFGWSRFSKNIYTH